jgi:hypothetical protein
MGIHPLTRGLGKCNPSQRTHSSCAALSGVCRGSAARNGGVRKWTLKSKSGKYRYDLVFRQHHPVIKDQANTALIPFGARGSLFY